MILDGHVHIREMGGDPAATLDGMKQAGVDGGTIISLAPPCFSGKDTNDASERLDDVMRWTAGSENLFPFFWIDPTEDGAPDQVARGVERGVAGFKVICDHFHPGEDRAMGVYAAIAKAGKPMLFHSGILWDHKASGQYCRPVGFEPLLGVEGLRFMLAHISWPWVDECIAVYGKFLAACAPRPELSAEMFIDVTPGTPPIYRRDALTKLFTVGYDVERNMVFGTDCNANAYNHAWARDWLERDTAIYEELGLAPDVLEQIHCENLRRFVGISSATVEHRGLRPGQ